MKNFLSLVFIFFFSIVTIFAINQKTVKLSSSQNDELKLLQNNQTDFRVINTVSEFTTTEIVTEYGTFNDLVLPGFSKSFKNMGKPHLPVVAKLIEFPYGATATVNIISYDEEIIELSDYGIINKLFPSQPSVSKSTDPQDMVLIYDEQSYLINDFNDDPLATVEFSGTMRGVNIGKLIISPIRYNPVTNTLKVYNNLVIEIVFSNADISLTQQLKKEHYSPMFESSYSQLINYMPDQSKDAITVYPITYVIVSLTSFQTTLQPFVQWKRRKGFKVIEQYYASAPTAATVKTYFQNIYNTESPKPTFALIVGDIAQIPTNTGTTGTHPSDLYYFTYDGGSDYIPELYYGRMSAESTAELNVILGKTLMHEQYTWPNEAFLDKCVMIAGVDATYAPMHGNGQIYYGINQYFTLGNGFSNVYAYLYGTSTHPYQVMSSGSSGASADIISKVSAGVGFANYTAHCSEPGWADPSFTTTNIPSLNNKDMYPLMIGNCCLSAKFNSTPDCFGEQMVYTADKGAVAYIGGSNNTLWDEDFYWGVGVNTLSITAANAQLHTYANTSRGAYDGVWHTHSEPTSDWFITAREMTHNGNLAVESSASSNNVYYWEIYHNMGDPSLMAYLSIPTTLTVSYADPITVGTTSLVVNTEQYAYVAISQNNVLLNAQYSGTSTSVTLTFPAFTSPGTADIVVTKQFRKPYIGTVDIVASATNNDAMVSSVEVPVALYDCAQTITPSVTIKNQGATNLTSCTVSYKIDGGTAVNYSWTGNLAQYATAVVTFPSITLTLGAHSFDAYTSNPNGVTDEYPTNDHFVKSYTVNNTLITAAFTADETIFCSSPAVVTFTNTSTNALTYLWNFGDGQTSTDVNPVHTYTALGDYTVTLTAYNGVCGNDIQVSTDFISIDPANPCEFIMPTTGTVTETSCNGTLFDSGGSTGQYGDDESAIYIISPVGASSITLTFNSFDIEPGTTGQCNYDNLKIYDGNSTAATLLGTYCNNNIPTTLTSSGGSVCLQFYSDGSVTHDGFEMDWACLIPTIPPVADFSSDVTTTCDGVVEFIDLSSNGPTSWAWDFGNGATSTQQNPIYTYTASGTFSVTLTATNAYGNDSHTITNMITVTMPTAPTGTGASNCGTGSVTLNATGSGTLEWYDAATNGTLVYTGSPYATGSLTSTTTYYVEDHIANPVTYNVGNTNSTTGGAMFTATNQHGLIFNCTTPFTLVSVEVNAQTAGNRVITLTDASNVVIQTATVNIPVGVSRIDLNFNVPVGNGLKLMGPGSPYLYRTGGTGFPTLPYPYEVPGILSIYNNTATNLIYYYFFYDWEIEVNEECVSPRTPVTATILTPAVVDATITASTTSICVGDAVTFTASAVNGGTAPNYNWFVNSVSVQNGASNIYTSSSLTNGAVVNCQVTSNLACNAGPDMSNNITMAVSTAVPVSVTVASNPGNTICAGQNVTFTATGNNGGATPAYNWMVDGVSVGTGATYSTTALTSGDVITCTYTSSLSCATGNPATSTPITMTVNPVVTPTVSINSSATSICAGETVNFTSSITNGGTTPVYSWMINGVSVATGSSYSSTTLSDGDVVTCQLTSSVTCSTGPVVSNSITINVDVSVPVSASISSNLGTSICTGELVTFTATAVNGGTTPSYQWYLNGSPVGTGSTYSSSALVTGDYLTCVVTSSVSCATGNPATSNQILMTVSSSVTPTIDITASDISICSGETVNFSSSVSGEGATPSYDWQLNGVSVGTGSSYSSSSLNDGDVVTCILTSSSSCASVSQVTSNNISITVNTSITPAVSILSDLGVAICEGQLVTFNATPYGEGSAPLYQWYVNSSPVGANSPTYVSSTLNNGDVVMCVMTSSEPCASTSQVSSNSLTFTVDLNPVASYYFSTNGPTLTLLNNSSNATSYTWLFGDGNSSTMPDPVHTYLADGLYTVILIASNSCGSDTISYDINIIGVGTENSVVITEIELFPNPTNGMLTVDLGNNPVTKIELYDVLGKVYLSSDVDENILSLDLTDYNQGIYYIKLYSAEQNYTYRIIVNR